MTEPSAEDRIFAVLTREKAEGSPYYAKADIRHFMPLFIITTGVSPELLDPAVLEIFESFVATVGAETADATVTLEHIFAYYERHPVNPELLREMGKALAQPLSEANNLMRDNLARLLATPKTAFVPRQAPSDDQVRAGPLARFTIDKKR